MGRDREKIFKKIKEFYTINNLNKSNKVKLHKCEILCLKKTRKWKVS